jgi:hypothetical protein
MRLSVNELETLARKAAVGAGVDHGHAFEAARALLWLCATDTPCLPGFVAALHARSQGETGTIISTGNESMLVLNTADGRPACPFYAAPAARDFAGTVVRERAVRRIKLANVVQPCLVLARLAMGQGIGNMRIRCLEPGTKTVRWDALCPGNASRSGTAISGDILDDRAADILLDPLPVLAVEAGHAHRSRRRLAPEMEHLFARGVAVDSRTLVALKGFYERTLVPDSHASRRHGAGAGLVDSD